MNCVAAVKDELQSMPGVSNVNVSFDTNSATFTTGEGYNEATTLKQLDGKGYTSTVAK
ncbi:MAG: cation transporter [Planctomycetota bacterium]|nr:cation transporter [Planctomycetota bacterium]